MANIKFLAALLISLFAIAAATTITTTVTTITSEDEGSSQQKQQGSRQECQQEIQKQEFNDCQQYLSSQGRDSIRMVVRRRPGGSQQECCRQIEQVPSRCRCAAIEEVVNQQSQQEQIKGEQLQKVIEKAERLPKECNWQQPQQCEIQSPTDRF